MGYWFGYFLEMYESNFGQFHITLEEFQNGISTKLFQMISVLIALCQRNLKMEQSPVAEMLECTLRLEG